jgi:two-component system LytT family sensor kinase
MAIATRPPRHSPLFLARQTWKVLLGLALCGGAIDVFNHVVLSIPTDLTLRCALLASVVWWISYIPLLMCALVLADRYRLDGNTFRSSFVIHLLLALAFAYLHTAGNALLVPYFSPGVEFMPTLFRLVSMNFPIDFVSYWAIVGATYAFHYYSESHARELAAEQLKRTAAELEAGLAEARLRALRAQLNPHFLFNTLNAVSTLAIKGQSKAVSRMLSRLSDLLRICIDEEGPQLTPLAKELEFIDSYLEIQRLLCGDRLTIQKAIAPDTLGALVPTMLLQPVVENAFVHGIARSSGPARLGIEAIREGGVLRLTITDSGTGFYRDVVPRAGIGLANTEARLEQLYGADYKLVCGRSGEGGALVTISLPCVCDLTTAASA